MKKSIQLADTQQGWAKLQRSLLDSPIIKNPTLIQIYTWSLLKANHQPKWFSIKVGKGYKEVYCDIGQFITGRNKAADELGMPGSTWYTNITKLKDYGYLEIESNSHYSLITIVNYGGAAPDAKPLEQPKKNSKSKKRTAKGQQKNTNNNYKNEKNKKKEKNNKNENYINNSNSISFQELKSEGDIEEDNQGTKQTYEYIVQMISEGLPNMASIPQQLSFKEFKIFFNQYDIDDIIRKLKEMDDWRDIKKQKSVSKILNTFLSNDKDVIPLSMWEKNRVLVTEPIYIDVNESQQYLDEVKDLGIWQNSTHGSSEEDKLFFIKEYLKWLKIFKTHERFKRLIPFSLEEAIEFEKQYEGFWLSVFDEVDLYYSSYLNKHTSMLGFLKEYYDHMKKLYE